MRAIRGWRVLALLGGFMAALPAQAAERRCGWSMNFTTGNHVFIDRDGMWVIAEQRGYQAPGLDDMPGLDLGEWVRGESTGGHGCACLSVEVDPASRRVTRILSGEAMPLAQCRADPALPRL